jgi:hypothetical protein
MSVIYLDNGRDPWLVDKAESERRDQSQHKQPDRLEAGQILPTERHPYRHDRLKQKKKKKGQSHSDLPSCLVKGRPTYLPNRLLQARPCAWTHCNHMFTLLPV